MPNAVTLLTADHRKVEQLFEQYNDTSDFDVAQQICQEITLHAEVEEAIVYPVLARIDRDLEQEAEDEHAEAKRLIAEIQQVGDSDATPDLVATLQAAIEHHVSEEESQAFPKLEEQAGDQLDDMGRQIEERKRATATR